MQKMATDGMEEIDAVEDMETELSPEREYSNRLVVASR